MTKFVFRLPDALTFPLAALGLLFAWYPLHELVAHIAGAVIGFAVFALIASHAIAGGTGTKFTGAIESCLAAACANAALAKVADKLK